MIRPRAGEAVLEPARIRRRAAHENFRVASRLLPRRTRHDLLAIYGVARMIDEAGDEAPGDREALLDRLERDVRRMDIGRPEHPLIRDMRSVVRAHGISPQPFLDLVEANRLDQRTARYGTFEDLLGYCALSANPVGHLVLGVLDRSDEGTRSLSDPICTGLQLAEHWQDVREDLGRGRIYLPQEDLEAFGVTEDDLAAPSAGPSLRALMDFEVARTRVLLEAGRPLAAMLGGRAGWAIRGFLAGGLEALDGIGRAGFDVLSAPPHASRPRRAVRLLLEALPWRSV